MSTTEREYINPEQEENSTPLQKQSISNILSDLHPSDIAAFIDKMDEEKKRELFNHLNVKAASEVILALHEGSREQILETIDRDHLVTLVEEMDSDDAADIIGELPKPEADSLLNELAKSESEEVRKLLQYDPDTAGGIMQLELFSVREGMLIEDAIVQFIASAHDTNEIHNVFVINSKGKLTGEMHVGELLKHNPSTPIVDVMNKNFISVNASMDQEEVAGIFRKYNMVSLPVVDDNGVLIGKIMIDDAVDVIQEEASEDMMRIAGIYEYENIFDSPSKSVKMRFPWLVLNLATATIAASIIGLFKDTINSLVILAVFMPIVAGMGGNAGTQALTVTIRGLFLGELNSGNANKIILKGVKVGLMNGVIVGSLMGLISYIWEGQITLALIIFLSMIINLVVANLFGVLIPLFLKKIKVDPAIASSVFLTSLTDSIGFLSFLGLAKLFIHPA